MTPDPNEHQDAFPKVVKMHLHASKESNWDLGEEIGLSEQAIREKFLYACYEVELDVEVYEDGSTVIVAIDGKPLT